MTTFPFVTLDVFTTRRFGGNPLVIFPDARGLDDAAMRALSKEFNLSEAAFVLPPDDPANTARVRIFTSDIELDFAGHPNVGVAWVLAGQGRDHDGVLRFEEGAGIVEVAVRREAGELVAARIGAPLPLALGEAPTRGEIAACASLSEDEVGEPVLASVGLNTVCVPVSPEALARARCEPAAFRRIAARRPDLSTILLLYLYADHCEGVRARMFAPLSGTTEDPATGSAASALVASQLARDGGDNLTLDLVQGVEMGRESRLRCEARRLADGAIRAWVEGACVPVLRGEAQV